MNKILFFGECMIEQCQQQGFYYGGDSLNSAIYLARTTEAEQFEINYITGVGQDDISKKLINCWHKEDIKTPFLKEISNKECGRYWIEIDHQGERTFHYDRENSAVREYFKSNNHELKHALQSNIYQYFYLSGISLAILNHADRQQLISLLEVFKNAGGKIIFDNNFRDILWKDEEPQFYYQQVMELTDIAFLTDEDEYAIYGGYTIDSIINRNQRWNIPEVIIKQGNKPCIIVVKNENLNESTNEYLSYEVEGISIHVKNIVDTCAAGDSFSAGYLSQRLQGKSPESSAKFAHKLAARVIQFSGAILPPEAMENFLSSSALKTYVK
jgi:2-dehydro-3-deoxygluconokinase